MISRTLLAFRITFIQSSTVYAHVHAQRIAMAENDPSVSKICFLICLLALSRLSDWKYWIICLDIFPRRPHAI